MKKFIFKFWARVDKEEKYLTLKVTPAQWPDSNCPNGYLFIQGNDFAIFVRCLEFLAPFYYIDFYI